MWHLRKLFRSSVALHICVQNDSQIHCVLYCVRVIFHPCPLHTHRYTHTHTHTHTHTDTHTHTHTHTQIHALWTGHGVAQSVEALSYKPEGRGCHWTFSRALGVDSASNRNEYQEYFLGGKGCPFVGLTNLPPSCAECHESREPQTPRHTQDLSSNVQGLLQFLLHSVNKAIILMFNLAVHIAATGL